MKKTLLILALLGSIFAGLAGCANQAATGNQAPAGDSLPPAATPDEAAATDTGAYTLDEVKYWFLTIIPHAYEVYWWYYGGPEDFGNSFVYVTADYQALEQLPSIAALKEASQAVFSRSFCESMLYPKGFAADENGLTRFQEAGGKLQIDYGTEPAPYFMDCYQYLSRDGLEAHQVKQNTTDQVVVELICTDYDTANKRQVSFTQDFCLVLEDGAWKLDNWLNPDYSLE